MSTSSELEAKTGSYGQIVQTARRAKHCWLEQTNGPAAPREFLLQKVDTIVGRSSNCDIKIDTSEISRRHMLVKFEDGEFIVKDLDSHNGVFINGLKVHSASLRDGDSIQIGNVLLLYHES